MNSAVCRRAPRRHQRGVTLVELMVGFAIAMLLTMAAVSFAAHETRLMGISRDRLDLAQSSRAAIDLLAEDLKQAGAGIGYRADGSFAGLLLNDFSVAGLDFNQDGPGPTAFDAVVGVQGPGARTDLTLAFVGQNESTFGVFNSVATDVGILTANGAYATIVEYDPPAAAGLPANGAFCESPGATFRANEVVVLRSQSSLDAFSGDITTQASRPCNSTNGHGCLGNCIPFTVNPDRIFESEPNVAENRSFLGGELAGGHKTIVWFSLDNGATAVLRRAVFDDQTGCLGRDNNCGGLVVDNVESFVVQAWTFSPDTGRWTYAGQAPIVTNDRIRVDVELVVRSRKSLNRQSTPVPLNLVPAPLDCVPSGGPCATARDWGQRRVIRTSVEVKNSGAVSLQ